MDSVTALQAANERLAPALYAFAVLAIAGEAILFARLHKPRDKRSRWLGIRCGLLAFGMGSIVSSTVLLGAMGWVYQHRLFDLSLAWPTWLLCFFINDWMFYLLHRLSHRVRFLWGIHVVHHSSRHYDLTAGVRGSMFDAFVQFPFIVWIPVLGIHPVIVIILQTAFKFIGLAYHTELVGKLGVLDRILVTPSNHRVHHGSDTKYLDCNYGGFFILWDRLLGTFRPEEEKPTYGLRSPWHGYGTVDCQLHALRDLVRDMRQVPGLTAKLRCAINPP